MSDIKIQRPHALPVSRARKLAEQVAEQLRDQFALDYRWQGNALKFERDGVQGELVVAKAEIRIAAQLGFLLSFLKPRIEQEILANLERMFGPPEAQKAARTTRRPRRRT
jgi:putative polyhydroxyalkanoate system protein